MDIRWDNPAALYALWLLVPVGVLLARAHRRRRSAAARLIAPAMQGRVMPRSRDAYPWIRGSLLLLAFACLGIAAARPRWGVYFEKVARRGADVLVLLDVSRSMLSQDVAPSRLERSKSDLRDLLRRLEGDRVGLIAFAGKAVLVCPLTTDHSFFGMMLDQVGPDSAPRGGTAIGDAIREALRNMEARRDRDQAFLLITDGEDHDSFPSEAAAAAAERGVKIFTVGMGDPVEGARVPTVAESGDRAYLKYQGQEVWSKMDEGLLQDIALKTQGAYVPAKTQVYDLGEVYENHLASLARSEEETEKRRRYRDRFQIFVFLALLLFVAERILNPFRGRAPAATLAMALIGCVSQALTVESSAVTKFTETKSPQFSSVSPRLRGRPSFSVISPTQDAGDKVCQGIAQFKEGKLGEALKLFTDADWAKPGDLVIAFNRAAVLQAKGDVEAARTLYLSAASAKSPELAARAHYNLGTLEAQKARAHFGEKPQETPPDKREEGVALLQQAVRHFRSCLELQPDHVDARHNLELIRLWLKHMADVWARKDREKQREEMDLLTFLEMLMHTQRGLQSGVEALEKTVDSPMKREGLRRAVVAQQQLADEIEPLKKKIGEALRPPEGQPDSEPRHQAQKILEGWADEAGEAMKKAASDLNVQQWESGRDAQARALEALERIWLAAAPFEKVLSRAIQVEKSVVERTTPLVEEKDLPDLKPLIRDQAQVRDFAAALPPKAEQGLQALQARPEPQGQDEQEKEKQRQQLDALRQAYQKAIELGPRIQEQAEGARSDLETAQPKEALPKEEEALKLLREIENLLPKDQQQQDPQNDQKDQQDQKDDSKDQTKNQDQQQKKPEPSQQRAEALLRKVKERERDYREKQKELQGVIRGRVPVERDW
ncbi:MAG: VWA domain-containing protein [Planctomycetes bacterium]|nr:VWA domain-containing protein [Planctomycetota bacterium]